MKNKKILIAILVISIALSCSIVLQMRSVQNFKIGYGSNDREINELRSTFLKEQEKYENLKKESQDLTIQLDEIKKESTIKNTELENLNNKIINYNNLAGLNKVEGQGIIITVGDSKINTSNYFGDQRLMLVHYTDLLMIINELKNARAQAISVNDQRIVDSTSINCSGNIITINNKKVGSPFEIKAIGNSNQLMNLNRPNGYLSFMKKDGLEVSIKQYENIQIDKYNGILETKYLKNINRK